MIDYKRLGETTGKAWRLGHMNADRTARLGATTAALDRFQVPTSGKAAFRTGFSIGVAAVDKERRKA